MVRHLALLAVLWFLFFWRFWASQPADQWQYADGDFTQQFWLFRNLTYRSLHAGQLPLWCDCIMAGYPLHADPQTQLFYPPSWLTYLALHLLGYGHYPLAALTLEANLHYLLISVLLYFFLRGELKQPIAALLGTLVFSYGGYLTSFPVLQTATIATLAWLPAILLCLKRAVWQTRRLTSAKWLAGAAVLLAISYLGGHPQTFVYVLIVSLSLFFYWHWQNATEKKQQAWWKPALAGLCLLGGVTFLLAAVQLLPSAHFILNSTRASIAFSAGANGYQFQDVLQIFVPGIFTHWQNLYLGILPLGWVALAVANPTKKVVWVWLGLASGALLLTFGTKAAVYDAAYWFVPVLRLFRGQEHFVLIWAFASSVLAGYGVDHLLSHPQPRPTLLRFHLAHALFAAVFVFGLTFLAQTTLPTADLGDAIRHFAMIALFAGLASGTMWLAGRVRVQGLGWLLLILLVADLFSHNRGQDVRPPYAVYPPSPLVEPILAESGFFRVQDDFQLPGHAGCGYGFAAVESITPYKIARYQRFFDRAPETMRYSLLGVRFVVTWRQALQTWQGARPASTWVASAPSASGAPNTAGISQVWRLTEAPARAWWAYSASAYQSAELMYEKLAQVQDVRNQIFIESASELPVSTGKGNGTVQVLQDQPGILRLQVTSDKDGWLVASQAWFPGWRAVLDGQAVPLHIANDTLPAVAVPAGTHTLQLVYQPTPLWVGAVLSSLTLLACLVLWLIVQKRTVPNQ
jgi:hypothetical protein